MNRSGLSREVFRVRKAIALGLVACGWLMIVSGRVSHGQTTEPEYIAPPFDAVKVALAIGELTGPGPIKAFKTPMRASAIVISPNGQLLTAYHVVASCVAALRRDPKTARSFHPDGAYYGEMGPLLCPGMTLRLRRPTCTGEDDVNAVDKVYLIAVPPFRQTSAVHVPAELAQIDRTGYLRGPESVPPAEYALLKVEVPTPNYLVLSGRRPNPGEPVWVAGYLAEQIKRSLDKAATDSEKDRQIARNGSTESANMSALFHVLVEAATDPEKGVHAAQAYARTNNLPTWSEVEARGTTEGLSLPQLLILGIAQGQRYALKALSEQLGTEANIAEQFADRSDIQPEVATKLHANAQNLRRLATIGRGSEVRSVMRALARIHAENARAGRRDAVAVYPSLSQSWCTIPVFYGRVTAVDEATLRGSAYSNQGMSGGPALNAAGQVIGIVAQAKSGGPLNYRYDNLTLARADTAAHAFGLPLRKYRDK